MQCILIVVGAGFILDVIIYCDIMIQLSKLHANDAFAKNYIILYIQQFKEMILREMIR